MSIFHAKTVTIADDPAVIAAGGVVPSDYNAAHIINIDGTTIHTHSNKADLDIYSPANFLSSNVSSNFVATSVSSQFQQTIDMINYAPNYHAHQAGIEGEPVVTDNGNGTINVASEDVWFYTDATRETLAFHTIAAATNLAPTSSDTSYLVADRDTNSWVLLTDYSLIDNNRYIPYLIIYKGASNNLHFQKEPLEAHGEVENHRQRVANCERYGRESGFDQISVALTTRLITTNSGVFWAVNRRYPLFAVTSASTRWFLNYHTGGVWTNTTGATNAAINNTQYDDGTNLQTLGGTECVINYLFRGVEDQDHLYIVLSDRFPSIEAAKASGIIGTLPELVTSHAVLIGRVIVEQGQDVLAANIESAFTETFAASTPVTQHNDLAGLQGGSGGTQYYHVPAQIYSNLTGGSYAATGFTGVNATGTLNSNGLSLSVVAPGGGGGAALRGSGTYSQNTGTVQFQNSNGVTFGLSNNGVMTASVAAAGGAQTGISSMGNSQTTYTSGAVQFVGSNAVTVRSTTGQGFVFDAPVQTVQTQNSILINGGSGAFTLAGTTTGATGAAITVNSQGVNISVTTNYSTGYSAKAESTHVHSFGTTATAGSQLTIGTGSAGISIGMPAFITTFAAQTVQTQNSILINGNSGAFTVAGTTSGSQSTVGSDIVMTHNSNGLNLGVPKYLTTAALSGDSTAYQTSVLSNTFFPSTQTTKFAGSGFSTASVAGSDIAGTVNSNGVSLGIPKWLTAAAGGVDGYNSAQFTNSTANSTMPLVWAGNSGGSGNITMGLTGSTITMSAPSGGGGALTLNGTSNGGMTIMAGGAIGLTNNASTISISAPTQTIQTQNSILINGNSGAFTVAGTNSGATGCNVTVNSSGVSVSISQSVQPAVQSFNGSSGQISFVTGSGMSTTTNASTITFGLRSDISTAWSGQTTANQSRVIGIAGSAASTASGNVQFANSNGLTFGLSANSVMTASHNGITSQTVQTQNSVLINGNSGAFTLAGTSTGATNASVTLNSNGINISVAAPGAAAENNWINLLGANTAGNTTVSGSTIGMSGVNLTLSGTNVSQMIISAPAVSVLSALTNITIGTTGSTIGFSVADPGGGGGAALQGSGTYTQNSGTVQFANSNGVTFGLSANGVMTASAAGGGVAISAGGSNFTNGTVSFGNQGLFSFSTSNGSVIGSYSDPDGWSIVGNTAGASNTLALSNGTFYLSGGANITLSQNGNTLAISGPAAGGTVAIATLDRWWNPINALQSTTMNTVSNGGCSIIQMLLPVPVQFSRVDIPLNFSGATTTNNTTAAWRMSNVMVIYTRTGNTLNPIVGISNTQSFSWASNNTASAWGNKFMSIPLNSTLPPDEYWIAYQMSTAGGVSWVGAAVTTNLGATVSVVNQSIATGHFFADAGASTNVSTNGYMMGLISSTVSNTSQTLQVSQVSQTGANLGRAFIPMRFRNV